MHVCSVCCALYKKTGGVASNHIIIIITFRLHLKAPIIIWRNFTQFVSSTIPTAVTNHLQDGHPTNLEGSPTNNMTVTQHSQDSPHRFKEGQPSYHDMSVTPHPQEGLNKILFSNIFLRLGLGDQAQKNKIKIHGLGP